jgi:hypothetical protein
MSRVLTRLAIGLVLLLLTVAPAMGYSTGPPTMEDGEEVVKAGCTCHGNGVPSNVTIISISGVPHAYAANASYALTVSISHSTNYEGGFMLSGGGVGVFSWDEEQNIRPEADSGEDSAATSTSSAISHDSTSDPAEWTFTWTAPSSDEGSVTFWLAGNAVDGSLAPDAGDSWNLLTFVINSPSETTASTDQSTRVISVGDYDSLFIVEEDPAALEAENQRKLSLSVVNGGMAWYLTTLVALIFGGVVQKEILERKHESGPDHLAKELAYPQGIRRGVVCIGLGLLGLKWLADGAGEYLWATAFLCSVWAAYGVYRTVLAAKTPPRVHDIM